MRRTSPWALLLALPLSGCDALNDVPWLGEYEVRGTWDLGGPFTGGRTAGDAIADLLVEQVLAASGVPSVVEDEAAALLDGLVRAPVKAVIDANAPAELAPDGRIAQLLATTLATVEVESTLVLEDSLLPGEAQGAETFATVAYHKEGELQQLAASELGSGDTGVGAAWEGKRTDDGRFLVWPHPVTIRYGELVRRVAEEALALVDGGQLARDVQAAVDCPNIVALVGGGEGLTLSVADWSHTVSAEELTAICEGALPEVGERVLGLVKLDSPIELGGTLTWQPDDETLTSDSDFGGLVVVGPRALCPRLSATLTATRR